jgi:EAL domain-containing protein (putative c-di-GMP-specific phosphodiesterase class I)/GGDEF domain-containing protein
MPDKLFPPAAYERDALTGLIGPEGAHIRIAHWEETAQRLGEIAPIHAMMLGLRRFETVNLAYGAHAGDSALIEVAQRILDFVEDELDGEWFVARMGGGSFLLAANAPCSRERWQWLAEALADSVACPIPNRHSNGSMRLWPRIALLRGMPGEGSSTMLDRLAETLSRAQRQSGHRILWADGELNPTGRSAAQLEADLLGALDRDEIEILYQPQYTIASDRLVGGEALARWQHPELGRIGAGALFAIAERADHVAQLSRHIAGRALEGAAGWPVDLRLSLNVTAVDLTSQSFPNEIAAAIVEAGFSPDLLTLEITEQALLFDLERSAAALGKLVDLGIRVALDDFGAGFCNFRYLKLLPLHYLKLDRVMVDEIESDPRDLAVFRAIVAMAKALDLKVIAEGIENQGQLDLIVREGCDFYQGFLRAPPLSATDFLAFASAEGGK